MGLLKASVVLKSVTGVAEDNCVNTFYFESGTIVDPDAPSAAEIDDVRDRLKAFYNTPTVGFEDLAHYLSPTIARTSNACSMEFYWNTVTEIPATWGSPYATRSWQLDPAGVSTSLPREVALVLSFHGDLTDIPQTAVNPTPPPATIRPAARRRGRIYLGPLQTNGLDEDPTTGEAVPAPALRTALADAGLALATATDADWAWVVASGAGETVHEVVGGWVDNAYDTQRRRGLDATVRTTWTA